jgi:hypothetical protein
MYEYMFTVGRLMSCRCHFLIVNVDCRSELLVADCRLSVVGDRFLSVDYRRKNFDCQCPALCTIIYVQWKDRRQHN